MSKNQKNQFNESPKNHNADKTSPDVDADKTGTDTNADQTKKSGKPVDQKNRYDKPEKEVDPDTTGKEDKNQSSTQYPSSSI